ncbi:MAG: hypothetical protein JWM05_2887 [Acidimicrobiales bacterium]|nr:hypothetical protein [Acidimicrobiales bacterium]
MTSARRLVLVAAVVAGLLTTTVAGASSVGPVTSAALGAFTGTGVSGARTVYASDNFSGTSGATLQGRALTIGGTWTVRAGGWTINAAGQANSTGAALGSVITATSRPDARVLVTANDSTRAASTRAGLLVRCDATATKTLAVYSLSGSPAQIVLAKYQSGAITTLATASGMTLTSAAAWSVELNGTSVKVAYNGTTYINHTLSAADQTTFGALGGHGMLNDGTATVRFDDFRVESL